MSNPLIGHASGDEHHRLRGGKAGEQNGREVFTRSWYNRPWNCTIEFKDPAMAEKAAVAMEHACANSHIGYDQDQRNTLLYEARKYGYDPGKVTKDVETDCSALAALCCMYAGIPESALYKGGNSAYTGNLRSLLNNTGKVIVHTDKKYLTSGDYNKRGTILLYEGHHVAIQLEDGDEIKKQKATEAKKTETKKEQTSSTPSTTANTSSKTLSVPYMLEITAKSINVRKNAGTQYEAITVLKQGDICTVTKIKNNWGYVNNIGWISLKSEYSKPITSFTGKVTAGLLNVREKASTDAKVLKTIKKDTIVNITKMNNTATWGYDSKSKGWVSLKFIKY